MASATPHTITLRSNNPDNMMQRTRENPCQAAVTITPGMLIEYGTTNTVKPHATAGGNTSRMVALENPWSDHGVVYGNEGPNIDHAYAAGETVFWVPANSGDVYYMLLEDGANIANEAPLESNGAGALQAVAGTAVEGVVGYAEEAVDNSAGGAVARIRVRIA